MTTTMSAKSPIDLIAFASVALGFTPTESVVMLVVGGPRQFHARVDIGTNESEREQVAQALLNPSKQHGVTRVVFLIFTDDEQQAAAQWAALRFDFLEAGIDMFEALHVTNGRFVSCFNIGVTGDADVSIHPIVVQAAFQSGRALRPSREAIRESLAMRDTLSEDYIPSPLPEAATVRSIITDYLPSGHLPNAALGTVLAAVNDARLRDCVLELLCERRDGFAHVALWADATARSPISHRAFAASTFAFASLMAGDGASAWIGVDIAYEIDPSNTLAGVVGPALEQAIPPATIADAILRKA